MTPQREVKYPCANKVRHFLQGCNALIVYVLLAGLLQHLDELSIKVLICVPAQHSTNELAFLTCIDKETA